jgi:hypothetical protein
MMSWRLLCAAVLGVVVGVGVIAEVAAQQQVPVSPDQPARVYDYVFPAEFDRAKRLSVRGYDDPGLGYSVGYQRGPVTMTIYIYDLGRKSIPNNADDPIVVGELTSSIKEAVQVRKNVELKKSFALPDARKVTRLNCAWLSYEGNVEGGVCLGAAKSKFIKFRTSAPENPDSLAVGVFFVRSWLPFFWPPS